MIIFVGDKPSAKNINPNIPFVGTQSYKRLLEWVWELDLDISEIVVANTSHVSNNWGEGFYAEVDTPSMTMEIIPGDKVIALGNKAEEHLKSVYINNYFKLPHPSGQNRKLNDKKYVKSILKECKEWLCTPTRQK